MKQDYSIIKNIASTKFLTMREKDPDTGEDRDVPTLSICLSMFGSYSTHILINMSDPSNMEVSVASIMVLDTDNQLDVQVRPFDEMGNLTFLTMVGSDKIRDFYNWILEDHKDDNSHPSEEE